jgi:DUF971 family protein
MDAPQDEVMPTSIQRDGSSAIEISWSDGTTSRWSVAELRTRCPCATCREKRQAKEQTPADRPLSLPVLRAAEARPLSIESMRPVGSYAYAIAFSDGHASGIFTFKMLRRVEDRGGAAPDYTPVSR